MPLQRPKLTAGDHRALQDTKLIDWYENNEKPLFALVVTVYSDFYVLWPTIRRAMAADSTLTDAVRNGIGYYFGAGTSSVGSGPANGNMYSRALQDHLNDANLVKNFNWQMYWGVLRRNQGAIEKLLTTFYNYVIVRAIDDGLENHGTSATTSSKYNATVERFNTTPGLFRRV